MLFEPAQLRHTGARGKRADSSRMRMELDNAAIHRG
jgi:hypothetical protein